MYGRSQAQVSTYNVPCLLWTSLPPPSAIVAGWVLSSWERRDGEKEAGRQATWSPHYFAIGWRQLIVSTQDCTHPTYKYVCFSIHASAAFEIYPLFSGFRTTTRQGTCSVHAFRELEDSCAWRLRLDRRLCPASSNVLTLLPASSWGSATDHAFSSRLIYSSAWEAGILSVF